ncbi:hypothetical protein O181_009501 [Austropuccinia psidii MF-1]|uniref:Uncharacterized protein n=1 Tax=Austropuccinia psidii MF-1 TaxID=1389203 RepID=A0A9Q3BPF1_9BASI|nr:hypothetical protein [Austropuccinia psidii MF-1]
MEKKNMMLLTEECREKNPPAPNQVPKTAPIARSRNSNVKKTSTSSEQGKTQNTSHKTLQPVTEYPKDSAGCHGKCFSDGHNNDGIAEKGGSQMRISEIILIL